jgi:hypothetical protein
MTKFAGSKFERRARTGVYTSYILVKSLVRIAIFASVSVAASAVNTNSKQINGRNLNRLIMLFHILFQLRYR